MNSLTRDVILEALGLLADRLEPDEPRVDLIVVGGAAMVLLFGAAWRDDLDVEDARRLLKECRGAREDVWREVETYVVPAREMKARYAFDDLWESEHGTA